MRKVTIASNGDLSRTLVLDEHSAKLQNVVGLQLTIEKNQPLTCDMQTRVGSDLITERVEVISLCFNRSS